MTVIYGMRPVDEAVRAGRRRVRRIWAADTLRPGAQLDGLLETAARSGVAIARVGRAEVTRRAGSPAHQGLVAEADPLPRVELEAVLGALPDRALLMVLDGVQDPQNLGAVMRSVACAGGMAVVVPRDRAVGLTPAAVKVAAGAAEHVPVVEVTNLRRALEQTKRAGVWAVGLQPGAAKGWTEVDLRESTALVLGAECRGLRPLVGRACDHLVSIPMAGAIASLNVAAAAAVALFEVVRQRRVGEG